MSVKRIIRDMRANQIVLRDTRTHAKVLLANQLE